MNISSQYNQVLRKLYLRTSKVTKNYEAKKTISNTTTNYSSLFKTCEEARKWITGPGPAY